MWLDIVDKARLVNLEYIESIALEHDPEERLWTLVTISHRGVAQPITSYKDSGEASRALDRVRHALQTIVLSSDAARSSES